MRRSAVLAMWLAVSAAGCGGDPTEAPPPVGPLAIGGWAGDFAAEPASVMAIIRAAPAWLPLARGRARAAFEGFGPAPQSTEARVGRWRAGHAVAAELAMLARGVRAVADEVVDRHDDALRRATWRAYLNGDAGASPTASTAARLGAALLAERPARATEAAEQICTDATGPAEHRLLACALVGDVSRGLAAADEVDWVALAEAGRDTPTILPVDPAPLVALAHLYRIAAEEAVCGAPETATLCAASGHRTGSTTVGAPPNVVRAAGLFASPPRAVAGSGVHPVAFAGLLRTRRDRHRAWLDGLAAERRGALSRFRAADEALCAELLDEAEARLSAERASDSLALLQLFPQSTCAAVYDGERRPSGRQAALRYAAAVDVHDAQTAYATADARVAALAADGNRAHGPWRLAAQACRWWHFSRALRAAPPLPSE